MTPTKLSDDQRQSLRHQPDGPISVEDDQTRRRYVLVDQALHARAMLALKQQEDMSSIQEGIRDLENGDVVPFEESGRADTSKTWTALPRMIMQVVFTRRAERELEDAADWWTHHRSQVQAARWYKGFSKAIASLFQNFEQWPFAHENGRFPYEIR